MAERVCPRCGHPNSVAANYCSSCGFDLHRAVGEDTSEHQILDLAELEAETPTSATLVIKRGAKAGTRYDVSAVATTIGRHPESDIFLDDVTVSRRHAEVRRIGDAITISDAGSLNGTYLNRSRIETATLRSGDEVQIGKFRLVFLTDEA